jgi:hypothetical protein
VNEVLAGLRRGIDRADDLLLAARDRLTPGQRWTATILASVGMAVLLLGAPTRTVVVPAERVAGAAERPAPPAAPGPAPARPFEVTVAAPARPAAGAAAGAGARPAPTAPPPPPADLGAPAPAATPVRVTALLPPSSASLPGRGEADVAAVFLAGADFEVAATAATDAGDACAEVGGDGTLVLGPEHVPAELLACLAASGATVLAFDAGGTREGVVSTRRAQTAALVALARWATSTAGVLDGPVGIVGGEADEPWIEGVLPEVRAAGVEVVRTAFVAGPAAVGAGVRDFVADGVGAVILAAPADVRRQWAAQHGVLDPVVVSVVADAHDGVTGETYAPTFDGALAHTTLRVPWHARAHGETTEQTVCRERWEAAAVPPRMSGGDESRWVHAWCQHVALASAARQAAAASAQPVGEVLRTFAMPSPLTADLGPLDDGGWGPSADAVVVWRASCACWEEQTPFAHGDLRASDGALPGWVRREQDRQDPPT